MTCVASYTENHGALDYTKHILQAIPVWKICKSMGALDLS